MNPIYEQGGGKGLGYSLLNFKEQFNNLCQQHLDEKRAKAFAFIFYENHDTEFRKLLNDKGVFVQLDRLSGKRLSIFYLHPARQATIKKFNTKFLSKLGVAETIRFPCIVFFKFQANTVSDIFVVQLNSADLIHGFSELYDAIELYINQNFNSSSLLGRTSNWIKVGTKFISKEAFDTLLDHLCQYLGF